MTGVLIAFAITLLVPLFVGTWRTSLLGLAIQGALLASIALRHGAHFTVDDAIAVVDLVVLRAIGAPLAVYLVLRAQNAPPRNDVIAPNLISWALALALVVVAFRTADVLVPQEGDAQMLVAASSSAFLLGMFVLATSRGTVSQIIGLMRIENGIALFELGSASHHGSVGLRLGMTGLLLVSVLYYRWFLIHLSREEPAPAVPGVAL